MTALSSEPGQLSSPRRKRPLISLTPLIDVVFILLVFFMLASSFLDWHAINLEPPVQIGAGTTDEPALLIEIEADRLSLAGEAIAINDIAVRLEAELIQNPNRLVLISPGPGVPLQTTVDVLDRVRSANAASIRLVRQEEDPD